MSEQKGECILEPILAEELLGVSGRGLGRGVRKVSWARCRQESSRFDGPRRKGAIWELRGCGCGWVELGWVE